MGLDSEPGNTPEEKDEKIKLYPWGKAWPPPPGVGNYCGVESKDWTVIEGYNDGYRWTSPVGSFAANKNGLYDMGGNVWQWCEDWYNSENKYRVLRGASWREYGAGRLLTSSRNRLTPVDRHDDYGFRCVVARESSR